MQHSQSTIPNEKAFYVAALHYISDIIDYA